MNHGVKFTQSIIEEESLKWRDFLNVYFIVNFEFVAGTLVFWKILSEYFYPCNKNSITWVCLLVPIRKFCFKVEEYSLNLVELDLNPSTSIIWRCRIDLRIFKKVVEFYVNSPAPLW